MDSAIYGQANEVEVRLKQPTLSIVNGPFIYSLPVLSVVTFVRQVKEP